VAVQILHEMGLFLLEHPPPLPETNYIPCVSQWLAGIFRSSVQFYVANSELLAFGSSKRSSNLTNI
jgi:hypothetical protein